MKRVVVLTFLLGVAATGWTAEPSRPAAPAPLARPAIDAVLDDFHDAAARADEARYFRHLTEDAVFLGTDATERWTKAAFQAYARPHFDREAKRKQGKQAGWTFRSIERHVSVHPGGQVAWFDERLASAHMGECRGSGLLVKVDGKWRIAQYNLTVPIPNDIFPAVKQLIDQPAAARAR